MRFGKEDCMKLNKEKINLIMARKQLSVKDVCETSGLPKETFKQAKNGARNATPKTIGRIAAALGVDVTEIIATEKGES